MFLNSFFDFINRGDHAFVQSIFDGRTLPLTKFFVAVTDLGGECAVPLLSVVLLLAMWFWKKRYDLTLPFIVTIAGAIGTSMILKYLIQRVRPDEMVRAVIETGFSMPSIHATSAMALYGFFIYFAFKESTSIPHKIFLVIAGAVFISLIGFSRIYLGVHYPSDVLAGFVVGFVWLFIGVHLKHRSTL